MVGQYLAIYTFRVEFGSFDILEDEKVRQGLKKYSNWPTYPQLYANGELVGGLDIVKVCAIDPLFDDHLPNAHAAYKLSGITSCQ